MACLLACVLVGAHASTAVGKMLDPLPPAGAAASAYGPKVRSGHGHPNADDLAGVAEQLRERGDLSDALQLSERVLAFSPENVQAIQTQVSTLSDIGAANLAYRLARHHAAIFPLDVLNRLRVDKAAADIRNALQERRRLDSRYRYAERNDPLKAVLPELDANLRAFPRGSSAFWRTQGDRLLLLRELGRMDDVLKVYHQLQLERAPIAPYVLRAVADAYRAKHRPAQAAALYKRIIDANPGADVEIFIACYYALVDAEEYGEADHLLARIVHETPVWVYGRKPHGQRSPNWERVDVDQLQVLDQAFRNHQMAARRRARKLYEKAPRNTDLINTYATVLRWGGWPEHAERVAKLANAYAPEAKDTRINIADDARDLGQYQLWHETIVSLAKEFPEDSTIRTSLGEWNDRGRVSISTQAIVGHSSGNNIVHGNRDQQVETRINAPWSTGGWRIYAQQDYVWSSFPEGNASFNRYGTGIEWGWGRKKAWALISNDQLTGRNVGAQLGWSQWLNDEWQYTTMIDSYSPNTPLRAKRAGLRGREADIQVNWRESDARSASLDANLLKISDGNYRESISFRLNQRLLASAHHLTNASLLLDGMHDTRPGGTYFNPADLRSVGLQITHDWITWRSFNQSLTQHFLADVALEWQSQFSSAPGYDFEYSQSWKLSRTWSLNYGLGWGSHVYDGGRERRIFGIVGISGVF